MATEQDDNEAIAILGGGLAGKATLANTLLDIANSAAEDDPPIVILLLDTRDDAEPKGGAPYPLNGNTPKNLHPFTSDEPPEDFPTFGTYVSDFSDSEPRLRDALLTPTYRQVREYLQFVVDLAIVAVADKAQLEASHIAIKEIRQTTPNAQATISFTDGTSRKVRQVIKAKLSPHMAGPQSG
jgi:hypothetical protein